MVSSCRVNFVSCDFGRMDRIGWRTGDAYRTQGGIVALCPCSAPYFSKVTARAGDW